MRHTQGAETVLEIRWNRGDIDCYDQFGKLIVKPSLTEIKCAECVRDIGLQDDVSITIITTKSNITLYETGEIEER